MRTSWGLIVLCSSQNLREAVETKSPLCHLSAEFYYCFDPDGCPDKRRNPFKSYNGCNLISGQQNCHEQRTLLLLFFSSFFLFLPFFCELWASHPSQFPVPIPTGGSSSQNTQQCAGGCHDFSVPSSCCHTAQSKQFSGMRLYCWMGIALLKESEPHEGSIWKTGFCLLFGIVVCKKPGHTTTLFSCWRWLF